MEIVSSNPTASNQAARAQAPTQTHAHQVVSPYHHQQQQYHRQQQQQLHQQQLQARSRRVSTYDLTGHSPMVTTTNVSVSNSAPSAPRRNMNSRRRSSATSINSNGNNMLPTTGHDASFPVRLHQLLNTTDDRIIRWQPRNEGKSFTILNGDAFEREVLPRLYRNANVERFGQLLSYYGFQRVGSGPFKGDYYHTMFIKDKPHLTHMIRKVPDHHPSSPSSSGGPSSNPTAGPTTYVLGKGSSMAFQHSLASSMRATVTSRLTGLAFAGKLHYLLSHGVYDLGYERVMSWQPGGHSFAVHSSEDFEIQGLAEMLGTPGHASFRAQLSLHGFQRVRSDGPDNMNVEAYYHPDFVREQPQLCRLIRSRNHAKSSIIHQRGTLAASSPSSPSNGSRSLPGTPKTRRERIVSPLTETSTKTMIDKVPESLFLDTHGFVIANPSQDVLPRSAVGMPTMDEEAMMENGADVVYQNDKGRKRPRVGHLMPQTYFPFKLHSLLNLSDKFGLQHILCWAPHGRCFLVGDKDLFSSAILPLFRHSEFASFRAQLKAYGYVRINRPGPDKGAYYHRSFLRGRPEMCATITRRQKNLNGTVRGRPKGQREPEPDFYRMKFLPELDVEEVVIPPAGDIKDVLEQALTKIIPPPVVTRDVSGNVTAAVPKLTKKVFSGAVGVTNDKVEDVSSTGTRKNPLATKNSKKVEGTFPVKLHTLLNDAHEHVNRFVAWDESGDSFSISDEKRFEEIACVKWLKLPTLAIFVFELEAHGFKRKESGAYHHEMFHKALPHLSLCIKREQRSSLKANSGSDDLSSVGSHHPSDGISINREEVPATVAGTRRASSLSTISAASIRANSPEMEVAMALTFMDKDNRSRMPSPVMPSNITTVAVPEPVSPLKSDDHSHSSSTPSLASASSKQSMSSSTLAPVTTILAPACTDKPVEIAAAEVPKRQMSDPPGRYEIEQALEEQKKAAEKERLEQQKKALATITDSQSNVPMEEVVNVQEKDIEIVNVPQTHTDNGPVQEEQLSSPTQTKQQLTAGEIPGTIAV